MTTRLEEARRIAARLIEVPGIIAVAVGGSVARGDDDPASDIDLGLLYRASQPPIVERLRALAASLDDDGNGEAVTELGAWGPWIDGGAWLTIDGVRVDWLYRDIDRVARAIDDCRAGHISVDYQPGHPHGFHNHMYRSEVALGRVLEDPTRRLSELQAETREYPAALKRALVARWLWEARFSLALADKSTKRGDVAYLAGSAFRTVASLVQVLFALNERPFINEKGSLRAAASFARAPADLAERVEAVLGQLGRSAADLERSRAQLAALVRETEALCRAEALPVGG